MVAVFVHGPKGITSPSLTAQLLLYNFLHRRRRMSPLPFLPFLLSFVFSYSFAFANFFAMQMSPSYLLFVLIGLVCVISSVYGDDYMQHPRGNNNRFRETSADRQNANRLFDSQNNARGGYCWGPPLTYYEGTNPLSHTLFLHLQHFSIIPSLVQHSSYSAFFIISA